MKVCVLSYKGITKSKKYYLQLVEELKKRFDSVLLAPIDNVTLSVNEEEGLSIKYKNVELSSFDAIIPRIGPKDNVYIPNAPEAYLIANNKFRTLIELSKHYLHIPRTILTVSPEIAKTKLNSLGEPLIIKQVGKSGGKGVVYANDIKSAKTIIDALPHKRGQDILLEEYIENPGEDIRLFVVGDEVVAAAKRVATKEEIRSNIHAGGKYEMYTPSASMKRIAIEASKVIGAGICGVDMIEGPNGPVIIECNLNPGFVITEITGVNIPKRITDYVYEQATLFWKKKDLLPVYDKLKNKWEAFATKLSLKFKELFSTQK